MNRTFELDDVAIPCKEMEHQCKLSMLPIRDSEIGSELEEDEGSQILHLVGDQPAIIVNSEFIPVDYWYRKILIYIKFCPECGAKLLSKDKTMI